MTPRNLFNIILKIFGLFFIKDFIQGLPQLLASIYYYLQEKDASTFLTMFATSALILIFYGVIIHQLIFNTNKILNVLKLEQDLHQPETQLEFETEDNSFSFDLSAAMVLTTAIIVIAGVIFINQIPELCYGVINYFKQSGMGVSSSFDTFIVPIIKIVIALLLVGERKRIIDIVLKNKAIEN